MPGYSYVDTGVEGAIPGGISPLQGGEPLVTLTWEAVVLPGAEVRSRAEYRTVQPARATTTMMQPARIPRIS